jgi:hypothetical protein
VSHGRIRFGRGILTATSLAARHAADPGNGLLMSGLSDVVPAGSTVEPDHRWPQVIRLLGLTPLPAAGIAGGPNTSLRRYDVRTSPPVGNGRAE